MVAISALVPKEEENDEEEETAMGGGGCREPRFSEEWKQLLLREVKKRRMLWQVDHPEYRQNALSRATWEEVAFRMGGVTGERV